MPVIATLNIGGDSYDVLGFRYGFRRSVDGKGRPKGGMSGGEIIVELESTGDTALWERLVAKEFRPVRGSLEVWDTKEHSRCRTLSWEDAYIYSYDETLDARSGRPMTFTVAITPLRLDIDTVVSIDRRWPQTHGFWWEEYSPEESTGIAANTSIKHNFIIKDAYWLDETGNEIRDIDVGRPVTLYVVLDEFEAGSTVNLVLEDDSDQGLKKMEYSGDVNSDGIIVIENFQLEPVGKY